MLKILKNSFFGSIILNVCGFFVNAYNNSILSRNVQAVARVFKESYFFKTVRSYVNRKPYYENSLIHRFVLCIVALVDKLMAVFNKAFTALVGGSSFCKAVMDIYNSGRGLQALSLVAGGICLGFAVGGSIVGIIGAVVFLIVALTGSNALKNCFVYRFICWLVKS